MLSALLVVPKMYLGRLFLSEGGVCTVVSSLSFAQADDRV